MNRDKLLSFCDAVDKLSSRFDSGGLSGVNTSTLRSDLYDERMVLNRAQSEGNQSGIQAAKRRIETIEKELKDR